MTNCRKYVIIRHGIKTVLDGHITGVREIHMIKFSFRKDKEQKEKTVVTLDVAIPDLKNNFDGAWVDDWTAYGMKVALQTLGRAEGGLKVLEDVLKASELTYTISEGVEVGGSDSAAKTATKIRKLSPEAQAKVEALLASLTG